MLNTPPNQGTYSPPKCMLDGQWKYLVGVTEWHDHEHDAQEAHRLQARVSELEEIARLAAASVRNQAWAGICDDDILLEQALVKANFI